MLLLGRDSLVEDRDICVCLSPFLCLRKMSQEKARNERQKEAVFPTVDSSKQDELLIF